MMEKMPTAKGKSAAMKLPNTQIRTITVSGTATASAILRSSVTWLVTWWYAMAMPPT